MDAVSLCVVIAMLNNLYSDCLMASSLRRRIDGKNITISATTALARKVALMGVLMKIIGSPPESRRERRKFSSSIGPSMQRTEEHTSELQPLMRTSYAVFCL